MAPEGNEGSNDSTEQEGVPARSMFPTSRWSQRASVTLTLTGPEPDPDTNTDPAPGPDPAGPGPLPWPCWPSLLTLL